MSEASIFRRLFWAGGFATLLLGGLIAFTTGPENPDPLAAGLFGFCLGLTLALMTADGVVTGEIRLRRRKARRAERPVAFWAAVSLYGAVSVAIVLVAVRYLLTS